MKFLKLIIVFLLICGYSYADVIQLKSGELIKGVISEESVDYIVVDSGIDVKITYYLDEIDNIIYDDGRVFGKEDDLEVEDLNVSSSESALIKDIKKEENKSIEKFNTDKTDEYMDRQVNIQKKKIRRKIDKKIAELKKVHPESSKFLIHFDRLAKKINSDKVDKIVRMFTNTAPIVYFMIYAMFCFPLMLLAKKMRCSMLLAWVPFINILVMLRMAEKSFLWFFLFFIPIVNLFALFSVWRSICDILQKPSWFGIFAIIPGLNLFMIWYLAICPTK
ncbi:MAG: hypothetical protein KKD07_02990 [Candidatus Omnitrophica bacterium]|nr:hypothetical protein [Candidatus Omnitrophota bacterium]MBU4333387.1 hypothetical protein [Candidatus Omnitrophota bacterium]